MFSGQLGTAALGTWQLGQAPVTTSNLAVTVSDTLVFTDLFRVNTLIASVFETLVFSESLTKAVKLSRSISDTIVFTERFIFPIADTLVFTETLTTAKRRFATVSDTLVFTDLSTVVSTRINDTLAFTETITLNRLINLLIVDSLVFNDTGIIVKRGKPGISSDTLVFSDRVFREIKPANDLESLTFSDSLSAQVAYNKRVDETLIFGDSLDRQMLYHQEPSDVLVYSEDFYVYKRGTGMQLNGFRSTMVIQTPEFNDFTSDRSKLMLNRSMSNVIRTYVKTTKRRLLNYHWIIPRPKAVELRKFILLNHGFDIVINDWEGKRWRTKLKSDSIDFKEVGRWAPCGNKVEVTVEFEGTQI